MVEQEQEKIDQAPPEPYRSGNQFNPPAPPPKPEKHRRRPSRRLLMIVGLVLFVLAVAVGLYYGFVRQRGGTSGASDNQAQVDETPEPKTSIRMLATGDWIAHDAINAAARTDDGYDYSAMTTAFRPYFAGSDINFCNLATLAGGEQFGISGYPVFNAPTQWIDGMNKLGCNLYNTGTNHTNDKGQGPITAQADHIDSLPGVLAHAGANRSTEEQNQVRYFEVEGVKFAFVSYSTYSNSPNPNPYSLNRFTEPLVTTQMREARDQADIVIVSMRWGTEYSSQVNASQDADAQKLADLGADIILGHGPHVLQPVKRLTGQDGRETIVWLSLGNFLNSQLETEALTGCVAQVDIDIITKKVARNMCLPFYQHYDWTAEQAAAEDLLARHNFQIMPLYNAQELMAQSQLNTTVEEQMERIRGLVNTYTETPVINAADL